MSIPEVRRLLRAHAAQQVDKHAVMRAIVAHDDWHVPVEFVANVLGRTQLSRLTVLGDTLTMRPEVLVVYSDLETAVAAHAAIGKSLGPFEGGIHGVELFSRVPPSIETVVINEGAESHDKAYFAAPHFDNAAVWADVVGFEHALALDVADAVTAFARYDAFFVTLHANGELVTLRNYPGFTNALLLYTAPDCLAAFMARSGSAPTRPGQTTGAQIIELLKQVEGFDGVIVNAFGPGHERAFRLDELV